MGGLTSLKDRLFRIGLHVENPEWFSEEYGIDFKKEKGLYFVNYSHIGRRNKYSNICRGTIFYPDGTLAVLPFTRFFNLHEAGADHIDWESGLIQEKLDGAMVVAWCDRDGKWRLSTKRMVDELYVRMFAKLDVVDLAVKFKECFPDFRDVLDPRYWYIFEAVFPENRNVTDYSHGLRNRFGMYLLAMRHSQTLNEVSPKRIYDLVRNWKQDRVLCPVFYFLQDEKGILQMFEGWPADREGVVVVDKNFHRVKIKQKSYVRLHRIASNISSERNMIDLILDGESSEVLAYFPDMWPKFDELGKRLNMLKEKIATVFGQYNHLESQKEFALAVKDLPYASFLFRLRQGEDLKYQFEQMTGKKLEKYL